ncbi:LLM class F420-dependent oxidoreductase [Winogradskya consettensis]|uniref:LLM class F420-dependent oxidoreductase n=1 Tax=Winogradskya consettensis TaxID=113560 RepID=A0A919T1Z6_9ACTN|nr:LLM class F420-dependent oxidoreductase [Actinoplanes consettensis]GIM81866.1 LLM class F420-dependent oxidoreductase [Actinoplanes consettensis]
MKLGLHIADFTWPDGSAGIGSRLADIVTAADEAGFERISVMDHLWQIFGNPEAEMLEAYTALGFIAAHTKRAKLLTLVTGVTYRDPGLLAKAVTTLDVLSGGRAMLGIGAAWNEDESRGLGLFFPPTAERFERLEETLQICLQMFHGDERPFVGKHYKLGRLLNQPLPLSKPHPPILIGGGGEKKTLRFVAKYADSCNLFDSPEIGRKLDVLREHCTNEGRDYDAIEKTATLALDPGAKGEKVDELIANATRLAGLGFTVFHGMVAGVCDLNKIEILRTEVMPAIEAL